MEFQDKSSFECSIMFHSCFGIEAFPWHSRYFMLSKHNQSKECCPRANCAKRRARVLIPPGYLHPEKRKH